MWKCEKCGRTFKSANQEHYCGDAPQTIDDYIGAQPEHLKPLLNQVRDTLRTTLPEAQERISWRMPTFWKGRNIIHFAGFQKHIGLYPGDKAMVHFRDRLTDFKTSKGAIQLPITEPLPLALIAEIARWCAQDAES